MWRGYEYALAEYALVCLTELTKRGRHYPHHIKFFKDKQQQFKNTGLPKWLGNTKFHNSHKAALLVKDPNHYSQFGWKVVPEINYYWPIEYYLDK